MDRVQVFLHAKTRRFIGSVRIWVMVKLEIRQKTNFLWHVRGFLLIYLPSSAAIIGLLALSIASLRRRTG